MSLISTDCSLSSSSSLSIIEPKISPSLVSSHSNKIVVAIDLDDVLGNFLPQLLDYYNRTYNKQLELSHFKTLFYTDGFGLSKEEVDFHVFNFYHTEEFQKLLPFKDAQLVLKEWKDFFTFNIVTSRPLELQKETQTWIDYHFPGVFSQIICCNHHFRDDSASHSVSKGHACAKMNAEWFIDDSFFHIESVINSHSSLKKALLFDHNGEYLWSKSFNCDGKNIQRVLSWQEINTLWYSYYGEQKTKTKQ